MTWRVEIPDKFSLRPISRYMEFARGPKFLKFYGELPLRLGCNSKCSNNSSPDIPFYLFIHIAQLDTIVLTALVGQLYYTSGLAIWRHTGWIITAQLRGSQWCHTKVPAG